MISKQYLNNIELEEIEASIIKEGFFKKIAGKGVFAAIESNPELQDLIANTFKEENKIYDSYIGKLKNVPQPFTTSIKDFNVYSSLLAANIKSVCQQLPTNYLVIPSVLYKIQAENPDFYNSNINAIQSMLGSLKKPTDKFMSSLDNLILKAKSAMKKTALFTFLFVAAIIVYTIYILSKQVKNLENAGILNPELTLTMRRVLNDQNIEVKSILMQGQPNAFNAGTSTMFYTPEIERLLTKEELIAVLCHEYGHYSGGHMKIQTGASLAIGMTLFVFIFFLQKYFFRKTEKGWIFRILMIALSLKFGAGLGKKIVAMTVGRQHEYYADSYATKLGYGKQLQSALEKLEGAVKNIVCMAAKTIHVDCEKFFKVLMFSDPHPSTEKRIESIMKSPAFEKFVKTGDSKSVEKEAEK